MPNINDVQHRSTLFLLILALILSPNFDQIQIVTLAGKEPHPGRRTCTANSPLYRGADMSLARPRKKKLQRQKILIFIYPIYNHNWRNISKGKGKAVPLQAWSGPEVSRKLRFPDFMTTAQDGGKVVSLTHRPPLPPGNTPGTHFCQRLSRPQDHSATGRIMSLKNSSDTIGNRTRDLPVCSVVP